MIREYHASEIEESQFLKYATEEETEAAMFRMQAPFSPEFDKYFEDEEDGDES